MSNVMLCMRRDFPVLSGHLLPNPHAKAVTPLRAPIHTANMLPITSKFRSNTRDRQQIF
jgi:hypothetical protein